MLPRVVQCMDLPLCEPNTSAASVLLLKSTAFVAYETQSDDHSVALLQFDGCLQVIPNGPNDEARGNHRFAALGIESCRVQQIVGSPWIPELSSLLDRDGRPDRWQDTRHFVLTLKETTVEIAAKSVRLVGVFATYHLAMSAALGIAKDDRLV